MSPLVEKEGQATQAKNQGGQQHQYARQFERLPDVIVIPFTGKAITEIDRAFGAQASAAHATNANGAGTWVIKAVHASYSL